MHYVPGRTELADAVAGLLRPGDLCLTLGAGDLTSLPDELMADRRPGGDRGAPREHDRRPRDAGRAPRSARPSGTRPLGSRTTYRVGGTAALVIEAADEAALVGGGRAPSTGLDVPVLVLGQRLQPAGGRRRVPGPGRAPGRRASRPGHRRAPRSGPVAALALPTLARRTAAAGLHRPRVGGGRARLGRGRGADERRRPRLGHVAALVALPRRSTWPPRRWPTTGATDLAAGYRHTSLAATDVVVAATHRLAPGTRMAGRAAIDEIVRWRRANQPGGANAGSVFTNRPATRPAG